MTARRGPARDPAERAQQRVLQKLGKQHAAGCGPAEVVALADPLDADSGIAHAQITSANALSERW